MWRRPLAAAAAAAAGSVPASRRARKREEASPSAQSLGHWRTSPPLPPRRSILCQEAASKVAAGPKGTFAERLRRDTLLLLERGPLAANAPSSEQHAHELLEQLGATELAELFSRVEALAVAVDGLAGGAPSPPHARELAPVRESYACLLAAVRSVEQAVVGPNALPLSRTQWWVPLLLRWRYYVCSLFSWGLLPEDVVIEVAALLRKHGAVGIVDPLAGSGWHARLWREAGSLRTVALDAYAVRPVAWADLTVVADSRQVPFGGIPTEEAAGGLDAADASAWVLYLSWPPHTPETVGLDLLRHWPSNLLVYLGERGDEALGEEGLTGGRSLLEAIARDWEPLQTWVIPCWPGFADDLTVYRRKPAV